MHLLTSSTIVVLWTLYNVNGFPTDNIQTAVEGQSAGLRCSRTQHPDRPVEWKYKGVPDVDIFMDGRVVDKFKDRYELNYTDYTLTILIVTARDDGVYECMEDNGLGDSHAVRLQVLPPPPGLLSLVNRTETSLTIRFNQTGRVTGYNVSVNGSRTSDVTYSGIGQNVVTATVHNLIPGSRHNVSVWSSRIDSYSKTSTTANYSTVPSAPGRLLFVQCNQTCQTIIWDQRGRATKYVAMLDSIAPPNAQYFGVGTGTVAAVLCGLSVATKYKVNIAAVSDDLTSQATSGDFETPPGTWCVRDGVICVVVSFPIGIICGIFIARFYDRRHPNKVLKPGDNTTAGQDDPTDRLKQ